MKRIIKTTVLGTLAATAILASGCTKKYYYDCEDCGPGETNRITLSSEVQFAATPRLQDEQIVEGQSLSLFVTNNGSVAEADQLYINNRITANGMGGFTYRIPMYYPMEGDPVDFYAIHPYSADATLENPIAFSIQTDQTLEKNYLNSDLLFGSRIRVIPQVNAIPLVFKHKLSKLDFTIVSPNTAIDLNELAGMSVTNTLPQTTVDVKNGNITVATGTAVTVLAYGDAVVEGQPGDQTVTGLTAIIVPQTITEATPLFTFELAGEPYTFVAPRNYIFESGKKYSVMLDANTASITFVQEIEDWEDGGSIGGPAGPV